jgi:hypothetical protein
MPRLAVARHSAIGVVDGRPRPRLIGLAWHRDRRRTRAAEAPSSSRSQTSLGAQTIAAELALRRCSKNWPRRAVGTVVGSRSPTARRQPKVGRIRSAAASRS